MKRHQRMRLRLCEQLEARLYLTTVTFLEHRLDADTLIKDAEVVDFDGDGDNDIVASESSGISWYENLNEKGDLFDRHLIADGFYSSIDIVDMDSDGDQDIVAAAWMRQPSGAGCTISFRGG